MPPTSKRPSSAPTPGARKNRNLVIGGVVAALVIAALVIGAVVVSGGGDDSTTSDGTRASTFLDGIAQEGTTLGSDTAKVTLIQFEDPQCPVCRAYQDEGYSAIVDEYVRPGDVKLRYAGLAFIGDDSTKALRHILAAGEQNQLFQFAEELYARQGAENSGWVTDSLLEEVGTLLGLDNEKLAQDAASAEVASQIAEMRSEAETRAVQGTPWFFVQIGDGEPYEVSPTSFSIESFRPILDDALKG